MFEKLPSTKFYSDNINEVLGKFGFESDSTFKQWTVPVPTSYGTNVSSGVEFADIFRSVALDVNTNIGRNITEEVGVGSYGINVVYISNDSLPSIDKQFNADGTPQLFTLNVPQDVYNPDQVITQLFAEALGFQPTIDNTSISGGANGFSANDFVLLNTLYGHPVGYSLAESATDPDRGDTQSPTISTTPSSTNPTTNQQVTFSFAGSDNVGIDSIFVDFDMTGAFAPDTFVTSVSDVVNHTYTNSGEKNVVVAAKDANNNYGVNGDVVGVSENVSAPIFDRYVIQSSHINHSLSIPTYFTDPNTQPLSYFLISSNFPDLQINQFIGVLYSLSALPDSLAGNEYWAEVAATNGSEVTTEEVGFIINEFVHEFRLDYEKNGQNQVPIFISSSDRATNFTRNESTPFGVYIYNTTTNPSEFEAIRLKILNRPVWVGNDFNNYASSLNQAKVDSIIGNIAPYQSTDLIINVQ